MKDQTNLLIKAIKGIENFTKVDSYGDDVKIEGIYKGQDIKIRIKSRADTYSILSGYTPGLKYWIDFGGETMIGNFDVDPKHYSTLKELLDEARESAEKDQKERVAKLWNEFDIES